MKTCFGCAVLSLLTLIAVPYGIAQPGCENGIVRLPAGVNGAITICPAVASQAPDLARQLAAIQSAMSSQQAQLAQLTRLVNDINRVSGPLGGKRQAELLVNVTQRLGDARTVSGAQLQQRATTLSGHFEEVETQLSAAQADPAKAARTKAAMQGSVGDAIARLDFDTVNNQLSDIQATVHAVDERTKEIQGTVDSIQKEQEEQVKQQGKIAEDLEKTKQETSSDPRKELANIGVQWNLDNFESSTRSGDIRALELFLKGGFSANQLNGSGTTFVLTQAIYGNAPNFTQVLDLFRKNGLDFHAVETGSENQLFPFRHPNHTLEFEAYDAAAFKRNVSVVQILYKAGASPDSIIADYKSHLMADADAINTARRRPGSNDVDPLLVNLRGYAANLDVILSALGIPVDRVIPPNPAAGQGVSSH